MATTATDLLPGIQKCEYLHSSLYVGDLNNDVTEEQLSLLFKSVALVRSVKICRDKIKRSSLGYGFVNFFKHEDAVIARDHLNFTPLNGKPIRLMLCQRDPTMRRSGRGNVFVKNMSPSTDIKSLYNLFSSFGPILSCKLAADINGSSKGFGFVQFENEADAHMAIQQLNGILLDGKQIYAGIFVPQTLRAPEKEKLKFTKIFVKNLTQSVTADLLERHFGSCGQVKSASIVVDQNGISRGFGFVDFQSPDSAAAAIKKFNGARYENLVWQVGRAMNREERKAQFENFRVERSKKLEAARCSNLYVKHINGDIDDQKLKQLFSKFGLIKSSKVMYDEHGRSKGFGFVAFSTPDEASNALLEMRGKIIGGKPLYVSIAQRKDERRQQLLQFFAQMASWVSQSAIQQPYHPAMAPNFPVPYQYQATGLPMYLNSQFRAPMHHHQVMPTGHNHDWGLAPRCAPPNLVAPRMLVPYDASHVALAPTAAAMAPST